MDNCRQKETITKTAYPIYTNANLFFGIKKKGTSAKLTFLWCDILVKKGALHRSGMAAIPKIMC